MSLNTPEQIAALVARNNARKGKPLTSGKALTSVRAACKKMNEVRHKQARHILSNVDPIKLTADCHKCGRVPIKVMHHRHEKWQIRDQYLCWVGTLNRKDRQAFGWAEAFVAYPNQALDMWEQQNGNCALCDRPMIRAGNTTDGATLDHCHTHGTLRGFIHQGCNKGLGQFLDNPETLRKAALYLERSLLDPQL